MPRVKKEDVTPKNLVEAPKQNGHSTIAIELPIGPESTASFAVHVDMRLSGDAARAIRRIAQAYDSQQTKLRNGHRVTNVNSTIRKIIEEIEDAV